MDNTLWDFTGNTDLTTGQITYEDGVSLYINNVLVPWFFPGSTSPGPESVTYTGPTGGQNFSLVYGEDDGAPAVLTSNLTAVPERGPGR